MLTPRIGWKIENQNVLTGSIRRDEHIGGEGVIRIVAEQIVEDAARWFVGALRRSCRRGRGLR